VHRAHLFSRLTINMVLTMHDASTILICAPNWLGDALLCMPALRAFLRERRLSVPPAVLCKAALRDLWTLNESIASVIPFQSTLAGTFRVARTLRRRKFRQAYILPNSFRAAWIPFLAGIPERIGFAGHWRRALLTRVVPYAPSLHERHQMCETLSILDGVECAAADEAPVLQLPEKLCAETCAHFALRADAPPVALAPGAARGPSKRWPAERFIELGRHWASSRTVPLVVLGTAAEYELCREVAAGIGSAAVNLAGQTSLPQLAAVLRASRLLVANDSGAMHLAAAVGTPLVAVFGTTDPRRTGPLAARCRIVTLPRVTHDRRIGAASPEARRVLHAIPAERVFQEAVSLLNGAGHEP
jgi:heptosyltransferase II